MVKAKKTKVEFSLDGLLNNPVTKKQLEGYIEEMGLLKDKIKESSEGIKDIRTEAKDALGIPSKVLNKLVKESKDPGSIDAEVHELDEVQQIAHGLGMN